MSEKYGWRTTYEYPDGTVQPDLASIGPNISRELTRIQEWVEGDKRENLEIPCKITIEKEGDW
jgi:hypothetical protein